MLWGMEPLRASTPPRPLVLGHTVEHWVAVSLSLVGLACLAALALLTDPDPRGYGTHEELGLPPCSWIEIWGIPCPGCGVTTSVSLFVHGHPLRSALTQPFGFLCVASFALFAGWTAVLHVRGRDAGRALSRAPWLAIAILGAMAMVAGWIWKLIALRAG